MPQFGQTTRGELDARKGPHGHQEARSAAEGYGELPIDQELNAGRQDRPLSWTEQVAQKAAEDYDKAHDAWCDAIRSHQAQAERDRLYADRAEAWKLAIKYIERERAERG